MAAGDSDVGICNLALIAIGEDPITSLNENSKAAILCRVLYHPVRRELLRKQPWNFAKKQAQLAANASAPLFTYSNAFPLPVDYIRVFDEPDQDDPEYEVLGGQILSNDASPFDLLYVYDCQDPTLFDASFVAAFWALLAARLAQPMTQSITKENEMAQKCQNILDDAALSNAQENTSKEFHDDVWLCSRR